MKYWMRYWYRHWDQGEEHQASKDVAAPTLAPGREQTPPAAARRRRQAVLGQHSPPGRPLPEATRARLEHSLGVDLSAVRVHHDPAVALAAHARALAVGEQIVLGKPADVGNLPLMGHEAAHVVHARGRPALPGISKPGGASEQEAAQAAQAIQAGRAAPGAQGTSPTPAVQRQADAGNAAPTDALIRREAVRIMLFLQYQQQGGQGAFTLTPAVQTELQRLVPDLGVAQIAALWTPEPAGPVQAFQRLVDAGLLPLFTAQRAPEPAVETELPPAEVEAQPSARASILGPGGPGFHVTINPRAPAPVSATIRQHLASRGLPFSYRELQALLAGREQGVEQIDQILRALAPQLGREDRIQLARTIADTLLSRSIQGQLQRELPTALEEELRRQGQLEQAAGIPARAQGSMHELLRLIPVGVSLTIHF
jgi:hypothetical protein